MATVAVNGERERRRRPLGVKRNVSALGVRQILDRGAVGHVRTRSVGRSRPTSKRVAGAREATLARQGNVLGDSVGEVDWIERASAAVGVKVKREVVRRKHCEVLGGIAPDGV